jgi:hypothetical protein
MNGKWLCPKCHSKNEMGKNRCGYCGAPQPLIPASDIESEADKEAKLTQQLHNIIEKLTMLQKKKLYRYFEDNVL